LGLLLSFHVKFWTNILKVTQVQDQHSKFNTRWQTSLFIPFLPHWCSLKYTRVWPTWLKHCFDVDAHYFDGCPLIHKYWSKTKNFIYNHVLKNNDFSLSIFMHIVTLNQIWKKVVNKLSFNLISFKMQELIQIFTITITFSERWSPTFNS